MVLIGQNMVQLGQKKVEICPMKGYALSIVGQ
jgi:hypothetical protein